MDAEESSLAQTHSVTVLIQRLKDEDREAAQDIWRRYFERLPPLARAKLKGLRDESVDEEDVLLSVFRRFFKAAERGRFANLNDRDDLWQILIGITENRVKDQYRKSHALKRGAGQVVNASAMDEVDIAQIRELAERKLDPEFIAAFNDNLARGIAILDDAKTREAALLKMEGCSNQEIADRLDVAISTVERKLSVIREKWAAIFYEE